MDNGIRTKQSLRNQAKSVSARQDMIEQQMTRFVWAVNQQLQNLSQRLANAEETLVAVVSHIGEEEVQAIVTETRVAKARQGAAEEKATLDEGIRDGYITAAEVIEEKSLIVGVYYDKDGKAIEPGRNQLVMPGIAPNFREKLQGQKVGVKLDLPDGASFEVLEIYSVDEAKAQALLEEKQKAAAAEAAAKEAATKERSPAAEAPTQTEESGDSQAEE